MGIRARFYCYFLAVLIANGAVGTLSQPFRLASPFPPEHKKELDDGRRNESASLQPSRLRVLVIDDEKNIRTTLSLCLEQMGCIVTAVSASEAALAALRQQPYELAFLDLRLGESNGLDLIPKLLTIDAGLPVIVITAYATIDTAVDAIKRGAADYLPKPFTPQQIRHVVDQSIKQRDLKIRLLDLEGRLHEATPAIDLETDSPKVRAVLEVAAKAAGSDVAGAVARRKWHGEKCSGAHDSLHEPPRP